MQFRRFEKWYPLLFSIMVLASYIAYCTWKGEPKLDVDKRREFLSLVVDVSAIAVGFIGALMGIVAGLDGKRAIQHLRSSGTYNDLIGYLGKAALSCLLLVVFSLAIAGATLGGIVLDIYPKIHIFTSGAWLAVATYSVFSCVRVLLFFWATLTYEETGAHTQGADLTK